MHVVSDGLMIVFWFSGVMTCVSIAVMIGVLIRHIFFHTQTENDDAN